MTADYKPRRLLPLDDMERVSMALRDTACNCPASPDVILTLIDRIEAAEAKVAAVESLHRRDAFGTHCIQCYDQTWPCPTREALDKATP